MTTLTAKYSKNRKLVLGLATVVLGMTGFGFAMVPLYKIICEITGIKTDPKQISENEAASKTVDDRWVTVEFVANVNTGMPWEFKSITKKVKVRPGQMGKAMFYARNKTNETIIGQAVPTVSPGWAGKYFNKVECFCFNQQTLKPGEGKEMPLRYLVDPELPEYVHALTLSYTFMNTDKSSNQKYGGVITPHAKLN